MFCWCFCIWLFGCKHCKYWPATIYFHQKLINKHCVNLHCEFSLVFFSSTVANWIIIKSSHDADAVSVLHLKRSYSLFSKPKKNNVSHLTIFHVLVFFHPIPNINLNCLIIFLILSHAPEIDLYDCLSRWSHSFGKQLFTEYETYVNLSGISVKQKKKKTQISGKRKNKNVKKINGALFWIYFNWLSIFLTKTFLLRWQW